MSDHKPTLEQQRVCYNHFELLKAEREGKAFAFDLIPKGDKVQYGNREILAALKALFGAQCQIPLCKGISAFLELEHINGDKSDYRPENLRIGCKSCNQKEHRHQVPQPCRTTSQLEKENTNATKSVTTKEIQEARQFAEAPTTFRKSKDYKHAIRIILMQATAHGQMPLWKTLRADIIARVGCSRTKANEYLEDYTESSLQPFESGGPPGEPYIQRRKIYDLESLSEEDRRSYNEAQELINKETAHKLEEDKQRIAEAQLENDANKLLIEIMEQVGGYVRPSELAISPVEYLQNPRHYQSTGIDGPTCLKCGHRKPMLTGQLVCTSCKVAIQGGNGHASKAGEAAALV